MAAEVEGYRYENSKDLEGGKRWIAPNGLPWGPTNPFLARPSSNPSKDRDGRTRTSHWSVPIGVLPR